MEDSCLSTLERQSLQIWILYGQVQNLAHVSLWRAAGFHRREHTWEHWAKTAKIHKIHSSSFSFPLPDLSFVPIWILRKVTINQYFRTSQGTEGSTCLSLSKPVCHNTSGLWFRFVNTISLLLLQTPNLVTVTPDSLCYHTNQKVTALLINYCVFYLNDTLLVSLASCSNLFFA